MSEHVIPDVNELRQLFLFEKLDERQLDWLCAQGHVEVIEPGWVLREGEPARAFYVLLEGAVALFRLVGDDDVEVTRSAEPGVYAGAFQAYLGDRIRQVYNNSLRATQRSRFYVLPADRFAELMRGWFPMALHLLEGLFFGTQSTKAAVEQRERLLALGSLSAGLTHELNNPAAAAVRATSSLRARLAEIRRTLRTVATTLDQETLATVVRLAAEAVERIGEAPTLSPMQTADLEDRIGQWLEDHRIDDGWELAAVFVQAGVDEDALDLVATTVGDQYLGDAIRWLNFAVDAELLMIEIEDSTTRISNFDHRRQAVLPDGPSTASDRRCP